MTYDEVVEKVAGHLSYTYCEGDPCPDDFDRAAARAIVDMLKPKLTWDEVGGDWISNGYEIETVLDQFMLWAGIHEGADSRADRIGTFPTLEAAKAAAQAHHETEHWKRTRIWEDE